MFTLFSLPSLLLLSFSEIFYTIKLFFYLSSNPPTHNQFMPSQARHPREHSLTHENAHNLFRTHTRTYSYLHALTHTHSHTHKYILNTSLTHTHTLRGYMHSHSHKYCLSFSLSQTHTHTHFLHTHTRTRTRMYILYLRFLIHWCMTFVLVVYLFNQIPKFICIVNVKNWIWGLRIYHSLWHYMLFRFSIFVYQFWTNWNVLFAIGI